jgi:hypothetical protein
LHPKATQHTIIIINNHINKNKEKTIRHYAITESTAKHEAEGGGHGGALPPERIYCSIPPPQRIQNMIHKIQKTGNNDTNLVADKEENNNEQALHFLLSDDAIN